MFLVFLYKILVRVSALFFYQEDYDLNFEFLEVHKIWIITYMLYMPCYIYVLLETAGGN